MHESTLTKLLENDSIYQSLLAECMTAESSYQAICSQLSVDDRAVLEHYISLCEEMDHRKIHLLLQLLP